MSKTKLYTSPELLGAMTANLTDKTFAQFKQNPNEFITKLGVEDISVQIAENSNKEINLTLPYYSELNTKFANSVSDDDMENITGAGEPGITQQQSEEVIAMKKAAGVQATLNAQINDGADVTISETGNIVHGYENDGSDKNHK